METKKSIDVKTTIGLIVGTFAAFVNDYLNSVPVSSVYKAVAVCVAIFFFSVVGEQMISTMSVLTVLNKDIPSEKKMDELEMMLNMVCSRLLTLFDKHKVKFKSMVSVKSVSGMALGTFIVFINDAVSELAIPTIWKAVILCSIALTFAIIGVQTVPASQVLKIIQDKTKTAEQKEREIRILMHSIIGAWVEENEKGASAIKKAANIAEKIAEGVQKITPEGSTINEIAKKVDKAAEEVQKAFTPPEKPAATPAPQISEIIANNIKSST
jgi:hypothetical protein